MELSVDFRLDLDFKSKSLYMRKENILYDRASDSYMVIMKLNLL